VCSFHLLGFGVHVGASVHFVVDGYGVVVHVVVVVVHVVVVVVHVVVVVVHVVVVVGSGHVVVWCHLFNLFKLSGFECGVYPLGFSGAGAAPRDLLCVSSCYPICWVFHLSMLL